MAIQWKISGGTVATATELKDLGLSGLTRTRRSLARDEIMLTAASAAVDSTALFAYGDAITVTRVEGGVPTTWFQGICTEVPRSGAGNSERTAYRIVGAWWYFEQLTYQQNWPIAGNSASRRAILVAGLVPSTNLRQDTKAFMQDVLDWLIGSGSGAVIQYTAANLPAGFEVPFSRLTAPTCAEAMQHIARYLPDAASWFDYTTTPPTFNLKRRSAAASASYALTALAHLDLAPRHDLKIDRLVIQYITVAAGGGVTLNQEVDPAGTTGREFGSVVLTLNNDFAPLAAGFAATYRAGLATLHFDGRLVVDEDECAQAIKPGDVVQVTGGLAAWATMNAQVQQVVEEVDAGRTTITVGPPAHLRIDDFFELYKIARNETDQFGGYSEILKSKSRVYTGPLTFAGIVPTADEISDALAAVYSGDDRPRYGDVIHLTVSSKNKFRAYIHDLATAVDGGHFTVGVTVGSVTKYAHVYQTGLF
ncbi:MAG: hypothetical protein HZA93_23895 [Verrucomicrobia bacterium]|nr:hypothetical protein [Verrucomicrobiota bacterium]